ncbi:MAG: Hsp70 family protein, partial [Myxococcota bacterium]
MSDVSLSIGIDLGTTHTALATACVAPPEDRDPKSSAVDSAIRSAVDPSVDSSAASVSIFQVPQLVAPGEVEALSLLPSFLYVPHAQELRPVDTQLHRADTQLHRADTQLHRVDTQLHRADEDVAAEELRIAGVLARELGAKTPSRLVSSAKSWLCHSGVDRRAPLLPLDAPEDVRRVSPLDASVHYLRHIASAWSEAHPELPLSEQEVVITVPASFDPAARDLTADAARLAGLTKVTLLEEPQAALYSWLEQSQGAWRDQIQVGDVILVVDVGGGTTDLSLIAALENEGRLELHRVAVGDHILLGGDNMDLTLAHVVGAKVEQQRGRPLDPWQMRAVAHACRAAKESLLAQEEVESVPIVVPSRGSKLIGTSLRTELTWREVREVILAGFFPSCEVNEKPHTRPRGALTQLGLPYAQDAAITRHLAAFLSRQVAAADSLRCTERTQPPAFVHPTAVLFNGGVFRSPLLRSRILEVLAGWMKQDGGAPPRVLEGADLEHAVARGAAYYGFVRRGGGVRIRGGTARAYYVGVERAMPAVPGMQPSIQALCVAPFGMEEGTTADAPEAEFGLVVGEPVHFRFFSSSVRREDASGTLLDWWSPDEVVELGEISATLPVGGYRPGEVVPVR